MIFMSSHSALSLVITLLKYYKGTFGYKHNNYILSLQQFYAQTKCTEVDGINQNDIDKYAY